VVCLLDIDACQEVSFRGEISSFLRAAGKFLRSCLTYIVERGSCSGGGGGFWVVHKKRDLGLL